MEKYIYTTNMGIQQAAFVRKVRIRYSFPQEHPSTGGKDDGARKLYGYPIKAKKTSHRQFEQNELSNGANRLLITVHCNMAGSSEDYNEDDRSGNVKGNEHKRQRKVAATARRIRRQTCLAVAAHMSRLPSCLITQHSRPTCDPYH